MQMGVTALSRGMLSSVRCNMVAWVFSTWRCWAGPYVSGGSGYKKLMLQGHGLDFDVAVVSMVGNGESVKF